MSFWLVMENRSVGERPFAISKARTVIGREPGSDVRIAMPTVAPRHCEITCTGNELKLTDLSAGRGTLHNGTPVREAVLADTDRLTVGPVTFHVRRVQKKTDDGREGFRAELKLRLGAADALWAPDDG